MPWNRISTLDSATSSLRNILEIIMILKYMGLGTCSFYFCVLKASFNMSNFYVPKYKIHKMLQKRIRALEHPPAMAFEHHGR